MELKFGSVGFLKITTNHTKKLLMIHKRPSKTSLLVYQITRRHIQKKTIILKPKCMQLERYH
jgi:hypothetical protein